MSTVTEAREKFDSICELVDNDPRAGTTAAALRYSFDVPVLLAKIEELEADLKSATTSYRTVLFVLADMLDSGECSLDHDGNCQEHNWFSDEECPQARAKRVIPQNHREGQVND